MATNVNQAQSVLVQAIRQEVLDSLEQTLDIVIPRAKRNELLKGTVSSSRALVHTRPAAPAVTEVHMPQGEKCAAIWHELDKRTAAGKETSLEDIRNIGVKKGWNEHTTRIQYYRWKHAQEA